MSVNSTLPKKRNRLKENEVVRIRNRYREEPTLTYKKLAGEYGMSILAINLLVTGKTWSHLPFASADNRNRGSRRGPMHPQSQLTVPKVRQMYKDYTSNTQLTYGDLSEQHGVSRQVVSSAFRHLNDWLPGENAVLPPRQARGARKGERHPFARLSNTEVLEMRELRQQDSKEWTLNALALKYDVCPSMVSRVVRGLSRKDAGGPIEEKVVTNDK